MPETETRGIERRYLVRKLNDPDGKHAECRFFVLDPLHDPIARRALAVYADDAGTPEALRRDLWRWLGEVMEQVSQPPPQSSVRPEQESVLPPSAVESASLGGTDLASLPSLPKRQSPIPDATASGGMIQRYDGATESGRSVGCSGRRCNSTCNQSTRSDDGRRPLVNAGFIILAASAFLAIEATVRGLRSRRGPR